MRILDRYIILSFLLAFVVTLLIFTFVMCIGLVFKVTDLLARGASWRLILEIFAYGIPSALSFGIPVSLLTASLLIFGKMSADREIVAMKSGGISLWQILSGPVILSVFLSIVCLYINCEMAPTAQYLQRVAVKTLGIEASLDLLEEGRFVRDFPGLTVYIGRKHGDRIFDIIIYDFSGPKRREIRAQSGTIRISEDRTEFLVELWDVWVDPFYGDQRGFCHRFPFRIPMDTGRLSRMSKKEAEYTTEELLSRMNDVAAFFPDIAPVDMEKQRTSLKVEMNKRVVLAVSCFAFMLLGGTLGIKAHRKESSIGIAMSLFLVLNLYVFMIIAESLEKRPEMHPALIAWFPILVSVALGGYLAWRSD